MKNIITFAFYKATAPHADWSDKTISWWTKGPYSHVELIFDNMMHSSSPRDGHVRSKPHKKDYDTWDYINVEIDGAGITRIRKFFEKTAGHRYDWPGILGFVIPVYDSEKKYFCSEWCSKAGIIGGIECLFDKNPSRISPNRLANILIKEGGYELIRKN